MRAAQVDRRAAPQLAERVVPDHRAPVVEAVRAQRLAEARVVARRARSPQRAGRRAAQTGASRRGPAAARLAVRPEPRASARPEARRGQRHEHRRMLGHGLRDALAAAQARRDQVVGVLAVALRARRADRLAAVPARLPSTPSGSSRSTTRAAARRRRTSRRAAQPDRARAVPGGAQLRLERGEVRPAAACDDAAEQLGRERDCGHASAVSSAVGLADRGGRWASASTSRSLR